MGFHFKEKLTLLIALEMVMEPEGDFPWPFLQIVRLQSRIGGPKAQKRF